MGARLSRTVPAPSGQHVPDQDGVLAQPLVDEQSASVEPTLPATLRAFALKQVPERFYFFLQLGIPWSAQFAIWGWRRSAAWMAVMSLFGMWALCERALADPERIASDPLAGSPSVVSGRTVALKAARRVTGFVAGTTAVLLVFEGFVRFFIRIASCPGCAG